MDDKDESLMIVGKVSNWKAVRYRNKTGTSNNSSGEGIWHTSPLHLLCCAITLHGSARCSAAKRREEAGAKASYFCTLSRYLALREACCLPTGGSFTLSSLTLPRAPLGLFGLLGIKPLTPVPERASSVNAGDNRLRATLNSLTCFHSSIFCTGCCC